MKIFVVLFLYTKVLQCYCYDLTILHVNDIHVRMEETNKYSGACKESDKGNGGCYGGIARLSAAVKQIQNDEENVIFLNGGDFYQGNVWYTHFKWKVVAHFANLLNFTAMALGNHEFDDHVPGFLPFAKNASFPIISANVDFTKEKSLEGLIPPSVTVNVNGKKIGIIGYVTTDTTDISNPDDVQFLDEVTAISAEAERLKASGVDVLIALGHSGYEKDKEIAEKVKDIDVVVGGHSHSFLYSGEVPSVEKPSGPYPTLVTQPETGRVVPVIQAYAYTKYLGYFRVKIDDAGEITFWEGSPKLLDQSVDQDANILRELVPWRSEIEIFNIQVVASTNVLLLAKRGVETNLGNFLTDSMVHWYSEKTKTEQSWSDVSLAIMNSGGIRGSFETGSITMADVYTVLPFENTIDRLEMRGKDIKSIFEAVAGKMSPLGNNEGIGGFLQVSGFHLTFDLRRSKGDRVSEIYVRCSKCKVPKMEPLLSDAIYNLTTVGYLATGGDGLRMIPEKTLKREIGPKDTDVFLSYAKKRPSIIQGIENRIRIFRGDHVDYSYVVSTSKGTRMMESWGWLYSTTAANTLLAFTIMCHILKPL